MINEIRNELRSLGRLLIGTIRAQCQTAALEEATDILEFCEQLHMITGEAPERCLELAAIVPPDFRGDARRAALEGMTVEQQKTLVGSTLASACWRMGLAGKDVARVIVGAPTVTQLLTPDDLGQLKEFDPDWP